MRVMVRLQAPHATVGAELGVGVTALERLTEMKKTINKHPALREKDAIMAGNKATQHSAALNEKKEVTNS